MHGSRYRGVLTFEEAARLTPAGIAAARRAGWLAPVGGAENDPPPADDPPQDPPKERETVPAAELARVRREKKALEDRLAQLETDAEERRKAELSETEKAKEAAAQVTRERDELQSRLARQEKQAWVRDAAARAEFTDTDVAVALLADSLGEFETEKDARDAVKELKNSKPYLVGRKDPDPNLKEVLRDGKHSDGTPQDNEILTMDDLKGKSVDEMRELLPRLKEQGLIPSQ